MSYPRWSTIVALAVVVALTVALPAGAQQQQRRGGGGGGFGGRGMGQIPGMDALALLNMEPVQKELKLSTDQTTKVRDSAAEAMSEMQEIFSGLQDLSPEERREFLLKDTADAEKKVKELRTKVDALLDAPQKNRLRELVLQRRGALGSLHDAEVASALKLTDEQKEKVAAMVEEARPGRGQGGGGGGGGAAGGDREAMRARMQAAQKERNEKALAILTAEQKAELEKMQGPKFDFPAGGPGGGRGLPGA